MPLQSDSTPKGWCFHNMLPPIFATIGAKSVMVGAVLFISTFILWFLFTYQAACRRTRFDLYYKPKESQDRCVKAWKFKLSLCQLFSISPLLEGNRLYIRKNTFILGHDHTFYDVTNIKSLLRLNALQTSSHSPLMDCSPLKEKRRNPMISLMIPNTGSTVIFRKR